MEKHETSTEEPRCLGSTEAPCYVTDFETLKDEICTITNGYRIFNNVPGPRIGKQDRENTAKTALLRLDRINTNTSMMLNVCNNALEAILKCVSPEGEKCTPNESDFDEVRVCLKTIKSAISRNT